MRAPRCASPHSRVRDARTWRPYGGRGVLQRRCSIPMRRLSSRARSSVFSSLPLPAQGSVAASSTTSVARQSRTTNRQIGNLSPSYGLLGCGYMAWFSAVSAKVIVAPSASRPRRCYQCEQSGAPSVTSPAVWRVWSPVESSGLIRPAWRPLRPCPLPADRLRSPRRSS